MSVFTLEYIKVITQIKVIVRQAGGKGLFCFYFRGRKYIFAVAKKVFLFRVYIFVSIVYYNYQERGEKNGF